MGICLFIWTTQATYIRHHVELHGHGDDIEADNCRYGEIEILWGDHLVDHQAGAAVVHVVGSFHHLWEGREVRQWTWYQMGRWEKETRGQTGEKLIESSTRSGLVQLYWHPTCLRVRGTSQRGLKPGGYQQLFQCLKVGELEYRWLSFPWRLTWQYGKYGGVKHKTMCQGRRGGGSICVFWCWTNVV